MFTASSSTLLSSSSRVQASRDSATSWWEVILKLRPFLGSSIGAALQKEKQGVYIRMHHGVMSCPIEGMRECVSIVNPDLLPIPQAYDNFVLPRFA